MCAPQAVATNVVTIGAQKPQMCTVDSCFFSKRAAVVVKTLFRDSNHVTWKVMVFSGRSSPNILTYKSHNEVLQK